LGSSINFLFRLRIPNNDTTRSYPRYKNHGTFTTADQLEEFLTNHNVSNGEPTDVMPGDYFTLKINSSTTYRVYIAGIDTEYKKGNGEMNKHHITCISYFGHGKMNSTDTTTGGYAGATTVQNFLDAKATEISGICGSHLLSRQVVLTNAVSNGKSSANGWYSKKLTLMTEQQIYGSIQNGNYFDTGEGYEKLPVFNEISPSRLFSRTDIWLRSVYSSTEFSYLSYEGCNSRLGASHSCAIIPVFCIG
jgi:hypothetical protein